MNIDGIKTIVTTIQTTYTNCDSQLILKNLRIIRFAVSIVIKHNNVTYVFRSSENVVYKHENPHCIKGRNASE